MKALKRNLLLGGGAKCVIEGTVRGLGGASPPVYMLKEALVVLDIKRCAIKGTKIAVLI